MIIEPVCARRRRASRRWVLEDVDPEVTGWDGRQSVAMAEAAYESARTNLPVKVR